MYAQEIYHVQKIKRDKVVDTFHNFFLFNELSKNYFHRRIFTQFKIDNYFKDNIIFKQNQYLNKFIFVKEGIIELTLQNISFMEFHELIEKLKETIINKAKESKINIKNFFDFNTSVDSKTHYSMNILRDILNQKQNFIFQRNDKGIFGEIEYFFDLPILLTGTIVSDRCLIYSYSHIKYKNLNHEAYILSENVKENFFLKVKTLLKRMIMVYNSYWRVSIEQLNKKFADKDQKIEDIKLKEKNSGIKYAFNLKNKVINTVDNEIVNKKINEYNNLLLNKSAHKKKI
jgi:hypothetical protein